MDERPPPARPAGWYLALGQIGLEMVAPLFLGLWLDHLWNTRPWLMLAGIVIGFVGGLAHLIQMVYSRSKKQEGRIP